MKEASGVSIPDLFVRRLRQQIGQEESGLLLEALQSDVNTSVLLNLAKPSNVFQNEQIVPWNSSGRILLERPIFTLDPLWHAGLYYVQESSSMFVGWILESLFGERRDLACLDLCAAPGGKSLNILNHLRGQGILISNEPVAQRNAFLRENIAKWGAANAMVTKSKPSEFAGMGPMFDLVLVDAPCSGEGMFRKDAFAREQWSEALVLQCARDQREILEEAWKAVRPGGFLIYSTCTFSVEENEEQLKQLLSNEDALPVRLQPEESWKIRELTSESGWMYRFMPHLQPGEGLTIGVIEKKGSANTLRPRRSVHLAAADFNLWKPWVQNPGDFLQYRNKNGEYYLLANSDAIRRVAEACLDSLYIMLPGLQAGVLKGRDLVPAHGLAISAHLNNDIQRVQFSREEALRFLRCESVQVPHEIRGWALVTYMDFPLGWVKAIPPRVNNYFPREWKIRMQGS